MTLLPRGKVVGPATDSSWVVHMDILSLVRLPLHTARDLSKHDVGRSTSSRDHDFAWCLGVFDPQIATGKGKYAVAPQIVWYMLLGSYV